MRKLFICLLLIIVISSSACSKKVVFIEDDFMTSTLKISTDDILNSLQNTDIKIIYSNNDNNLLCRICNNSRFYLHINTFPDGSEYGYIWDSRFDKVYSLNNDDLSICLDTHPTGIDDFLDSTYLFFYRSLDNYKYRFIKEDEFLNRDCRLYQFKNNNNVYNVHVDKETGICIKGSYSNDYSKSSFYIDSFSRNVDITYYIELINSTFLLYSLH